MDCGGCAELYIPRQIYFCPYHGINATETVATPSTALEHGVLPHAHELAAAAKHDGADADPPTSRDRRPRGRRPLHSRLPRRRRGRQRRGRGPPPGGGPSAGWPFPPPPGFFPPPPFPPSGGVPGPFQPPACWTPFVVQPHMVAGKTSTEYQETRTTTCELQCDGCALATSMAKMGYGPPVRYRTTVTKQYFVSTVYRCGGK